MEERMYLMAAGGGRYPQRCPSLSELDGDELPYEEAADAALPRHLSDPFALAWLARALITVLGVTLRVALTVVVVVLEIVACMLPGFVVGLVIGRHMTD